MTNKIYTLDEIRKMLTKVASIYGIEKIYLFGSYARGEANEKSDIDLYIPILPNNMGIKFYGMYEYIKEITDKNIDIITDGSQFSDSIEQRFLFDNLNKDKVMIYG